MGYWTNTSSEKWACISLFRLYGQTRRLPSAHLLHLTRLASANSTDHQELSKEHWLDLSKEPSLWPSYVCPVAVMCVSVESGPRSLLQCGSYRRQGLTSVLVPGWAPKNWCFCTVVLQTTLESPLDCKEMQPVHPEGDQSWVFTGRTDAEAEAPILWPPDVKS